MLKALLKQLESLLLTTRGGCVYFSHNTDVGKSLLTQETLAFKSPEFSAYVGAEESDGHTN